ncbi:MAG: Bug family tripartite tricarboxylate transporter substrate binding protein [Alphaproteobacteria bacterium]
MYRLPPKSPTDLRRRTAVTARRRLASTALLVAPLLAAGVARADAVSDFYSGKDVKLIVSSSPGGGYDTYARLMSRHIGPFIPGKPDIIVQNMPGAGGIKAGNYLFNVAPKDGSVFGGIQNGVPFEPLFRRKEARFDPLKFNWLGTPNSEVGMLLVWHTVPVKTLEDATKRETLMGSSGAASTPSFYARILNEVFGTRLKLITGYPGQTEAFLAMERGELEGYPSTFWSSLKATRPDWIKEQKVRLLVQYGQKPHPELPDVPVARDLAKSADDKALLDLAMAPLVLGRPYLAPPEVPMDRVAALRAAMKATFAAAAFRAEAKKLRLEVDPQTGEEMTELLRTTYAAPKPVVERLIKIYEIGRKAKKSKS